MSRISGKVKQRQVQTKFLEQQTKKMEQRLNELKKQVDQQKRIKSQQGMENTVSRWRKATNSNAPLKQYGKQIIEQQKQAYKKFGINTTKITGTKSFNPVLTKIKSQKQQVEQKNMTKIPKLMSSNRITSNLKDIDEVGVLPTQSIQNNFFKAKIQVKKLVHQKTLLEFLEENFVQQYYKVFDSADIKTMDDLRYVGKQRLQQLGVKPGHQVKIMKRIRQQFQSKQGSVPISKKSVQVQQNRQGNLVQLGYGDGNIQQYQQLNQAQESKKMQDNQERIEHKESNQNSQASQRQTENWLSQHQQNQSDQQDEQQYYDQIEFMTVPISEENCQVYQHEIMNHTQTKQVCPCYQCYKRSSQWICSQDQRKFCSQKCLSQYITATHKKCPQCSKIFFKGLGFYEKGLWFCSIGCCPNRDQIEQMFINWRVQE